MSQNSRKSSNREDSSSLCQPSLLESLPSNISDDSFNLYKSKSPYSINSSVGSISSSFISSTSETRNLNLHLLQGNIDRSWIDPWEMTPSAKFYQKNYESPTRQLVASSILPNSFFNNDNLHSLSNMRLNSSNSLSIQVIDENNANSNADELEAPLLDAKGDCLPIDLAAITSSDVGKTSTKFGPWDGVMTGALLNIWGVILFLRLGWIVGQAGIIGSILIILLSTVVTTLTTISMSAICTNGTVRAGGAYYIISRTIGPEFGGSVGMILSIASMFAVSLYLIGFAESLSDNLQTQAGLSVFDQQINDIRLWSTIFLVIVLVLAIVGLKYVIKAQILLLIWILFSVVSLAIGSFYRTSDDPEIDGVLKGFQQNFKDNLTSGYTDGYNFWSVLAIFFPAVTGIMAGANLSGDLRNPSKDIPKGTFWAIFISSTTYIILVMLIGSTAPRDSLINNKMVMTNICINEYIIYIATYAATISSAIASLVGAPRILQAVGEDNIINIPGLSFFTRANADGNPIRGYYLTAAVALCVNAIGKLDSVAPLISLFFIMVYLLINFSCFIMDISRSPGWRPGFKYFSWITALSGAILCGVIMFLLSPIYGAITVSIALFFYIYIYINDPNVSWGGAFHSRAMYETYRALLNLALTDKSDHSNATEFNWRPAFLVVAFGRKYSLTKYVETLRKCHSLIFCCSVIKENYRKSVIKKLDENTAIAKMRTCKKRGVNKSYVSLKDGYLPIRQFAHKHMKYTSKRSLGFNDVITTDGSYRNCMQTVLQNSGLGALRPNTIILNLLRLDEEIIDNEENDEEDYKNDNGYKHKQDQAKGADIECAEYIEILRDSLLYGYGVMICHGLCDLEKYHKIDWNLTHCFENIIDVWWIADDGGLILLIPYIMCLCTYWSRCKVRINLIKEVLSDKENDDNYDEPPHGFEKIQGLINKFRLNKIYHDKPRIIYVTNNNPTKKTINRFENLSQSKIQSAKRQNVILRWLKLSELLNEYSKQSMINVVTLPVPTSHIKPKQYTAILNLLSDQNTLPPTIIMRGNGEQTLTFYSE